MQKFFYLLIFVSFSCLPVMSQNYGKLCDRASELLGQDSLQRAEEVIRQALKLEPANPHNALLFSNLGTIQRRQRQYDDAIDSYTYALNIAPLSVPILLNRAALYLEQGKDNFAQVDYSLILDREKNNKEALQMRAYIYMRARDYKSARVDYDSLLKAYPLDYAGRFGLATLEQKEGRLARALDIFNKMLVENSEDAALYSARAGVERDLKHDDLALLDLEEAIKLKPEEPEAYLMRGQIYLAQKKKDMAKRDFEKAVSLGVSRVDIKELLRQSR